MAPRDGHLRPHRGARRRPSDRRRRARRSCATTPRCKEAYLGSGEMQVRPRATPLPAMPPRRARRPMRSAPATARCRCWKASPSRCARASWWRCSVPTAPASPPSCARSAACCGRCPASIRLDGRTCRAARGAPRSLPPALPWCRKAARCSPSSACATISCSAPTRARMATSQADIDALLDRFPRLKRAPRRPRRAALRRRAADAGHRPRPDGAPAHPAPRRALAGSGARHHRRAVRGDRRAARQRHHHPARRPDGGAGADRRRSRLRAGVRPHRARRQRRARCARTPALEAAYLGGLEAAE